MAYCTTPICFCQFFCFLADWNLSCFIAVALWQTVFIFCSRLNDLCCSLSARFCRCPCRISIKCFSAVETAALNSRRMLLDCAFGVRQVFLNLKPGAVMPLPARVFSGSMRCCTLLLIFRMLSDKLSRSWLPLCVVVVAASSVVSCSHVVIVVS